jgi:hypothetical protein
VKKYDLIALGQELSAEDDAASDLWTWLPSHKIAQKHHGDYAIEHRPTNADVMREAAMYFGHLKHPDTPLTAEEKEWFESCPCGEAHAS